MAEYTRGSTEEISEMAGPRGEIEDEHSPVEAQKQEMQGEHHSEHLA
jgi:hypothetical protein